MLDFIIFTLFSTLETYALFYLTFNLFKIDIYPKEMIFTGIIMAVFSFVLRVEHHNVQLDLIVQYLLLIAFMWLLFRIHIFYASMMAAMAYQMYSLLQTLLYYSFNNIHILKIGFSSYLSPSLFLLQTATASTACMLGRYIGKHRKGFDFIPDKQDGRVVITSREYMLLLLNLPSIGIVMSTIYVSDTFMHYYFALPLTYALILYGYLYLSYKKDRG